MWQGLDKWSFSWCLIPGPDARFQERDCSAEIKPESRRRQSKGGLYSKVNHEHWVTTTHRNIIQKLLPTDFSQEPAEPTREDYNEGKAALETGALTHSAVLEPVYVHVYRLKDSDIGFYHTGVGEGAG